MSDLTQYLDEAKAKIRERRKESEELERLRAENEELKQLIRETVRGSDAPKPIDWSQVAGCVPVKVWDERDEEDEALIMYPANNNHPIFKAGSWEHLSLITGIDIAWHGGECPLPEGVMVEATRRGGGNKYSNREASSGFIWSHTGKHKCFEIISFRITGIADGWTEEVGE